MDNDSLRKKLEIKMYCSKHPSCELRFSTGSCFGASSAYVISGNILIHPCSECKREAERIEDAARVLMSVANKNK